jgi:hypothetical protein
VTVVLFLGEEVHILEDAKMLSSDELVVIHRPKQVKVGNILMERAKGKWN